ncbi:MAG: hypothetical protein AAB370_07335 [Verrucomicrobiota bacterium]
MKPFLALSTLTALLLALPGCKDNAGTAETTPVPETAATPATPVPQPSPAANAAISSLPDVARAMQSGQYESAVQTLTQMKPATAQMTDAQRLQYQQVVRDATTALLGAMDRDPAAKAAYDKLSRSQTGR